MNRSLSLLHFTGLRKDALSIRLGWKGGRRKSLTVLSFAHCPHCPLLLIHTHTHTPPFSSRALVSSADNHGPGRAKGQYDQLVASTYIQLRLRLRLRLQHKARAVSVVRQAHACGCGYGDASRVRFVATSDVDDLDGADWAFPVVFVDLVEALPATGGVTARLASRIMGARATGGATLRDHDLCRSPWLR